MPIRKTTRYQINIRVKKSFRDEIEALTKMTGKSISEVLIQGWELYKKENGLSETIILTKNKYLKNTFIASNLRSRLGAFIKSKSSTESNETASYVGCTRNELKKHIESKFTDGMTWENKGRHGWHIDHILPLSHFDLRKKSELLKAMHYTNIQPLWEKDNLSKCHRMPDGTKSKRVIHK